MESASGSCLLFPHFSVRWRFKSKGKAGMTSCASLNVYVNNQLPSIDTSITQIRKPSNPTRCSSMENDSVKKVCLSTGPSNKGEIINLVRKVNGSCSAHYHIDIHVHLRLISQDKNSKSIYNLYTRTVQRIIPSSLRKLSDLSGID